jgi:hypothetical protein
MNVHIVRAAQVDDRHAEPSFAALAFGARLKPTGEKPAGMLFASVQYLGQTPSVPGEDPKNKSSKQETIMSVQ